MKDWVIRTSIDPSAVAASIRAAVREVDPGAVIANAIPMERQIELQTAERRFQTWLLTAFAALALTLAAVGIFGVMSHSAARRVHEIGIRMALGADRSCVLRLFLRQAMIPALIGLGIGTVSALAVTDLFRSLLYGITPTDPSTFIASGILLLGIASIATALPAWRASRVDPMLALRWE